MKGPEQPAPRGRPRTITRDRIADAGIQLGLPNITFVGVAAALGVSHMALYKHVPSLEALKRLVAEEVFARWQIPLPHDDRDGLQAYLTVFSASVRTFVQAHPGVTPYVIRRLATTPPMRAKIDAHQRHIAEVYGITQEQARWLLATVAFHTLAAADTVYALAEQAHIAVTEHAAEAAEMEAELDQGIQALIVGALALLDDDDRRSGSTRFLDTSALPIARVHTFAASATQIDQWLADIEALIQAKQDFVLVYERLPTPGEPGDPAGRKRAVLWLKAHRAVFETYCRGMVLMCADADALPTLQGMLASLEKVYRVPARVACTTDEMHAHVQALTAACVN